jgi:RHS repeat-associated protein
VDNSGTPMAPHVVINYGYDNANNQSSVSDNFGGTASYTFDNAERLTQATLTLGATLVAKSVLNYDNGDRLTGVTDSTGGTATINRAYNYDNADRLTQITDSSSSAGSLASYVYGYDNANRVTSYTGPDGTLGYSYDITNQLTAVTGAHTESYGYDSNGNRNTNGNTPGTDNRQQSDGTYNYVYDNEGNVLTQTRISDGQYTTFTWDDRNRLTEAVVKTAAGVQVTDDKFVYDVNDRRIGKSVNGVATWTAYDGANAFVDFNAAGAAVDHYLFAQSIDSILARVDSTNTVAFYLTDLNNSVRQLVSLGGVVLDQITYDSFGNILTESSMLNGDRFKYTAREWDSELALYYYRAREYAPTAGRFLSEDPSGLGPDVNAFRYVGNHPTNTTDPNGLEERVIKRAPRIGPEGSQLPDPFDKVEWDSQMTNDTRGKLVLYDRDSTGKKNWPKEMQKEHRGPVADGTNFTKYAKAYDRIPLTAKSANEFENIVEAVEAYTARYGKLRELRIYGHGTPGVQDLGGFSLNDVKENNNGKLLKRLGACVEEDGVVACYGCNVGADVDSLQPICDTLGREMKASKGQVVWALTWTYQPRITWDVTVSPKEKK